MVLKLLIVNQRELLDNMFFRELESPFFGCVAKNQNLDRLDLRQDFALQERARVLGL